MNEARHDDAKHAPFDTTRLDTLLENEGIDVPGVRRRESGGTRRLTSGIFSSSCNSPDFTET
jgi:hypothetical protein